MAGEVVAGIGLPGKAIQETGAVVDVSGSVRAPRERHVTAEVERVALVMVERGQFFG